MNALGAAITFALCVAGGVLMHHRRLHVGLTIVGITCFAFGVVYGVTVDDGFGFQTPAMPMIYAGAIGLVAGVMYRHAEAE